MIMLVFPITSIFVTLLLFFLPKIDPKGDNIRKSGPLLPLITILIAALMLGVQIIIIMAINGADILNLNLFISFVLGILFIVMGYYMPRVKHNYMVGIRTPWTLHSEKVWTKTHQVSKPWMMSNGALFLVTMFVTAPYNLIIPMIYMGIVLIGIVFYSYLLFAKEKK